MEQVFDGLLLGAGVALQPTNLLYCFLGVLLGTLVGVLPGIGPVPTIALLLPVTYGLPPSTALITAAGIYYGAQYGGSTTSILCNLPGEASSLITCIDGHGMARKGEAGAALAIAAVGSFVAGTAATVAIAFVGPPLAKVASAFSAADYFSLILLGLIGSVVLARGSVVKAIAMIVLGALFGMVGADPTSVQERLTFGIPALQDGIGFVPIAMGLFGIAEIMVNIERATGRTMLGATIGRLWPSREHWRRSWRAILRGSGIGTVLGVLPGGGAVLASFAAYLAEKRVSRTPERFGTGAVEGVAAPESANNAAAQSSFIPLLTLGIPANPVMALMLAILLIQNIVPGPALVTTRPDVFWGVIASMWVGNLMLLVLNLPLIGLWVRLLGVPYRYLFPAILVFCCIGAYSTGGNVSEIWIMLAFAAFGYALLKLKFEPAPMLLGYVLAPLMEEHFRRALGLSHGDFSVFVTSPISAVFLALCAALIAALAWPAWRRRRETAFRE
ncbi:MAG: tripartite tricarboxylate transporter permease [Candidatus Odyssella sp.]|nr:tripartite tricarboxylate transporter permease [Candidatus Odyssella sp.]